MNRSVVGFTATTTVFLASLYLLPSLVLAHDSSVIDEYVFKSGVVQSGTDKEERLFVGKKTTLIEIKSVMSKYRLELSMECEGFCIVVYKDQKELFEIYYDEEKHEIDRILSRHPYARDERGNRVGGSFIKSVGSSSFDCQVGESTYCESKTSRGVFFAPKEEEGCKIQAAKIPEAFTAKSCLKSSAIGVFSRSK